MDNINEMIAFLKRDDVWENNSKENIRLIVKDLLGRIDVAKEFINRAKEEVKRESSEIY